jgi:hypothetical protein
VQRYLEVSNARSQISMFEPKDKNIYLERRKEMVESTKEIGYKVVPVCPSLVKSSEIYSHDPLAHEYQNFT